MKPTKEETTHFGFQEIPIGQKKQRVAEIFNSVASNYDLMNDLMSFGLHRLWKHFTLAQSGVRLGQKILDVASGTGDLAKSFADKVGETGSVVLSDINDHMLAVGRSRLLDAGKVKNISYVQADAEQLPFKSNEYDCVTVAFGLRNMTDKPAALREMFRVLKPGGKLLVLEFSKPILPVLAYLYDRYSFAVIPKLGEWICRDAPSYQYLVESIRKHPDQETLKKMMEDNFFEEVDYFNLTGGIVALHQGYKY
jgi:demethylmenaquinone methyltransferase / 2-methoxy-6-polyprenyl-1,4-benzoquinol methylase